MPTLDVKADRGTCPSLAELLERHRPGWTLERAFYADPAIYEAELDRIFRRHWLVAGHAARIPKSGDFFTWEVAGAPLLLVRGSDGEVRALLNVCRHRGTRVCEKAEGSADGFVCPYHQWTYAPDGALTSARLMPPEFDKSRFGLRRVAARVQEGLILVSLAENPPDLAPALAAVRTHLDLYDLARTQVCHTEDYLVRANWKVVTENYRECYHCAGNHPQLCAIMPHIALTSPRKVEEFLARVEAARETWRRQGIPCENFPMSDRGYHAMRFPFKDGVVSQTVDGRRAGPLLGRLPGPDVGVVAVSISPSLWLEASCDHAVLSRLTPAGPDLTRVRVDWLVRAGGGHDPERVTGLWRATFAQDWELCEKAQAGVTAWGYEPGPFAPGVDRKSTLGELGPRFFVEWYLREMGRAERCE